MRLDCHSFCPWPRCSAAARKCRRAATAPPASYRISPEARQCLSRLGASQGVLHTAAKPLFCRRLQSGQYRPAGHLRSDEGKFQLDNLGPVTCQLANTFSGWARFGIDRAARQMLGSGVERIETLGSYACRNVAGTDRLSAHIHRQCHRRCRFRAGRWPAHQRQGMIGREARPPNSSSCARSTPAPASASAPCWARPTTPTMPTTCMSSCRAGASAGNPVFRI